MKIIRSLLVGLVGFADSVVEACKVLGFPEAQNIKTSGRFKKDIRGSLGNDLFTRIWLR